MPDRRVAVLADGDQVVAEARAGQRGADDVGHRGDLAVLEVAVDLRGHRGVEDRHQHRHVLVDVAHHQGEAQHDGVVARDDRDLVDAVALERVADLALLGRLHPVDLGARGVERLARLLGQVTLPDQQDRRHGRTLPWRRAPAAHPRPAAARRLRRRSAVGGRARRRDDLHRPRREPSRAADLRDIARGRRLRARRRAVARRPRRLLRRRSRGRLPDSFSTPRTRRPPRRSGARSRPRARCAPRP